MQEFNSQFQDDKLPAALYVVSTPIGNFGDITLRAIEVLRKCDFVICEDSRIAGKLLTKLEIKKSLIIYNDQSDSVARQKILNLIIEGKRLALISDAGTPLISDPGYKLVAFILEKDLKVISIPGACSAIAALSISGIPSDRFMFVGFVPSSAIARNKFLKELANIDTSLIFFESNQRLLTSLESMLAIFGNRKAAVVREITKIYEETKKADLQDLVNYYQEKNVKGEIVILLAPPSKKADEIDLEMVDIALKSGLKTMRPKDLVALIADNYQLGKKVVYQRMLAVIADEKR